MVGERDRPGAGPYSGVALKRRAHLCAAFNGGRRDRRWVGADRIHGQRLGRVWGRAEQRMRFASVEVRGGDALRGGFAPVEPAGLRLDRQAAFERPDRSFRGAAFDQRLHVAAVQPGARDQVGFSFPAFEVDVHPVEAVVHGIDGYAEG